MISKAFANLSVTGSFTDTVLMVQKNRPSNYNPNGYQQFLPTLITIEVATNDVYCEFFSSEGDDEPELEGGILLRKNTTSFPFYTFDFSLGLYKVKLKSATGSATVTINGTKYVEGKRQD